MEFKFTIDIEKYDDVVYLQDAIIERASEIFINNVLGRSYDEKDLYKKLEKRVVEKLEVIMDTDFKNEVAIKVTDNLTKKFEKTKQYKILKSNEEVTSDNMIKSGLRDLVADIVRSEMKKVFK